MSYVVEAAIGIDDKGATATRGWFRIDPARAAWSRRATSPPTACCCMRARWRLWRLAGPAERRRQALHLAGQFRHRRGARVPQRTDAGAFTEVKPTQSDDGNPVAYLAEGAEYDDEQARLAGIQRLLVIAGYDAAPIDGVDGPKTQNALAHSCRAAA